MMIDGEYVKNEGEDENMPSIWCVVANVTRTPHAEGRGANVTEADQFGTKHFAPGAKLYLFPARWGDGGERMVVLGRHRGGSKLIQITVATKHLENFRAKEVFQPHVVSEMQRYGSCWTEHLAREFAASLNERHQAKVGS